MSTPDPVQAPASIPWYSSPVFRAALVSFVAQVFVLFKLGDNALGLNVGGWVDLVMQFIALTAAGWAMYKRHTSAIQPLAMNRKSADVKSADINAKHDETLNVKTEESVK